ncbi:MAG: hypothetical protein ACOX0E_02185 [Syntrophomonadaceae bacterium]
MKQVNDPKKTPSRILNIIALIVCLVLIPLIIFNTTIIVKSFTNPDEIPGFMGIKPFIVLSDSMQPFISSGDLVVTKEISADQLSEGQVITPISPGPIHRPIP